MLCYHTMFRFTLHRRHFLLFSLPILRKKFGSFADQQQYVAYNAYVWMSSSQSELPEDLSTNVQKLLIIFSQQTKELTTVTSHIP